MFLRVGAGDAHAAAAGGTHGADVGLEAVGLGGVAAVVAHRDGQEVVLDVGPGELLIAADETAGLEVVGGAQAGALEHPFDADGGLVVPEVGRCDGHGLQALVLHVEFKVVLQVVAYARQVQDLLHAGFLEPFAGAHTRALQDLRRGNGAPAQEDLAAGVGRLERAAIDLVAHAHGTGALEDDGVDQGAGLDDEAAALAGHVQVAAGRGGTPALTGDETVHRAEAFLLVAVEVVGARVAGLHTGLDHGLEERIGGGFGRGHFDGAVAAVVGVGADVPAFGLAEVGQHVVVAPVGQAVLLRPVVEVQGVATDVAHAVDQRRAAQALAPATVHAAVVHMGLGIGLVAPVVGGALQRHGQCGRHLGPEVQAVVGQARFQQQDADIRILGQAGRQDVAGRAGTDDDVVVSGLSHEKSVLSRKE